MDRKWLTFAALAAGLVAVSLAIGLTAGGSSGSSQPITLERATSVDGRPELLVTVTEDQARESNGKGPTVDFVCSDADGVTVIEAKHPWPLERDGDPPLPHIHQPASQIELGKIERCEITGTKLALAGRLGLR